MRRREPLLDGAAWFLVVVLVAAIVIAIATSVAKSSSTRSVVAERTIAGLRYFDKSNPIPMANTGWILEAAGHRYNVNPALIAAIAAVETELGRTACLPFNAWGLGACGRAWTPPSFHSWRQSTFYFARHLRTRFLNRGDRTIDAILRAGYCIGGCSSWAAHVRSAMSHFRLGYGTTYPRR